MRVKFRETLWFKKGLLDAEAAEAQAQAQAQSQTHAQAQLADDEAGAGAVDTLPVEDRYLDDGTLAPSDSVVFGLHTGSTQMLGRIDVVAATDVVSVPERTLVAEMKTGRRIVFAMMALAALALGSAAAMMVV